MPQQPLLPANASSGRVFSRPLTAAHPLRLRLLRQGRVAVAGVPPLQAGSHKSESVERRRAAARCHAAVRHSLGAVVDGRPPTAVGDHGSQAAMTLRRPRSRLPGYDAVAATAAHAGRGERRRATARRQQLLQWCFASGKLGAEHSTGSAAAAAVCFGKRSVRIRKSK